MKIVAISDTHCKHRELILPQADMIIHAGDISSIGKESEVKDFLNWYADLDYKYKLFIAGNHDYFFEIAEQEVISNTIPETIIYLNDSGIVIEGIKIWGSPVQPWFYNWAFNKQRGKEISEHWKLIPKDTDILITHGPPYGILDKNTYGKKVGCIDLLHKIQKTKIKKHIFGHIHEGYGLFSDNKRSYINASVVNSAYQLVNRPVVFSFR